MRKLAVIIAFTAMSLLALEVVWMRLFAIESFSSFGYMILSVALLGFGVGGVLMTMFSKAFAARREHWLYLFALGYLASTLISIASSKVIPFVPQNIIQDPTQFLYIGLFYITLCLPFVFGSLTIGLILTTAGKQVGKLYFADLVGSGLGGILVLLSFYWLHPRFLPLLVVILHLPALVGASLAAQPRFGARWAVALAAALITCTLMLPLGKLNFSEFKGISYSMASAEVTGAKVVDEAWGPLGYVQLVSSKSERTAPALSTQAPLEAMPPVQKGLYIDGSKVASLSRTLSDEEDNYLDWLLGSLPYALTDEPEVLLVGIGGGEGVTQALHHSASKVIAADINSVLTRLVADKYADENGKLLRRDNTSAVVADGRDFAARHPEQFDMVQVSFLDASGLSFPGAKTMSENYLYTVESVTHFLQALRPGGILVLSTRVNEPPRGSLRLASTLAHTAIRQWGIEEARESLVYIRSEFHGMALARRGGFKTDAVELLLSEAYFKGFTVSYHPGMKREAIEDRAREEQAFWEEFKETEGVDLSAFDTAAENVQDPFFDCLQALLFDEDGGDSYLDAYPFDITPTFDDRPYFSAMLKSGSFDFIKKNAYDPDHWTREVPPDMWAQPVVIATMLQAALFALLIMGVPLIAARKRLPRRGKAKNFVYFSCLAVGFMFVEMVLIQKFTLFVAAPAYAAALVLSGMLVFSGIGAAFSTRFVDTPRKGMLMAVVAIVVLAVVYNLALTPLLLACMSWSEPMKVLLALAATGPVAFFLGHPFPLALSSLSTSGQQSLTAWGWAVNGAVSVLGIVLAQVLAMQFGFSVVLWSVGAIYLLALVTFPD